MNKLFLSYPLRVRENEHESRERERDRETDRERERERELETFKDTKKDTKSETAIKSIVMCSAFKPLTHTRWVPQGFPWPFQYLWVLQHCIHKHGLTQA